MKMEQVQYPYQNTNPKNIRGEKWKEVPGFEDAYMVSSYGRIKSLERTVSSRWGTDMQIAERIRLSRLSRTLNKTTGTYLHSLVITLNLDGEKYYYSVSRLVYHCFVAPIDLNDRTELISFKDEDGRNTHFKNLYANTLSEMLLTSYQKKRHKSHLSVLSKTVTQYNSDGTPVGWYASFYEAAKKTGFGTSAIAASANRKGINYKGYFWRIGHHHTSLLLKELSDETPPDNGINKTLQQRLGIRLSKHSEVPAYLNLSLKNLKGEHWKPFPGHEGLYEISSFGRVKSLRRISGIRQNKWVTEKIKKLTFTFLQKPDGTEIPGAALVSLDKDEQKKTYSAARYVYYCFVASFDLNDASQRIYYKDGNSCNLSYKNLMLKNAAWSINSRKQGKALI